MSELEKAKEVILKEIDSTLTIKTTKWVENEAGDGYIEVDAGRTKKEMEFLQSYQRKEMRDWYKLRDLLEDLI